MSQFAAIAENVTYIPGDDMPVEIPRGRVGVDLAPDSATLSWEAVKVWGRPALLPVNA
jgi:hypothetical protein